MGKVYSFGQGLLCWERVQPLEKDLLYLKRFTTLGWEIFFMKGSRLLRLRLIAGGGCRDDR